MESDISVNILMVDDHPENLLALEAVLADEPYRLIRANSGSEALKCLLRDDISLILLDVQMPDMDGFETARHIQAYERSRHIPIIFLSATSKDAIHLSAGYSAGGIDYMVKPFVPQILKAKVQAFVRLFKMQLRLQQQTVQLTQTNEALVKATEQLTKAEAQARIVMETSLDAVVVFDRRGTILRVNPAAAEQFGYPSDKLVNRPLSFILPGLVQSHFQEIIGKRWETELLRQDGSMFPAEIQLGHSTDVGLLFACTIRDITERRKAEEALIQAKEAAERASSSKSGLLAFLSHKIRDPLSGVTGMMDLLMESDLEPEQRKLADMIMQSANAMVSIMNNLLDYSRLESGGMELKEEAFSLRGCLEQVRDIFAGQLKAKQLDFVVMMDPELPSAVLGDAARLRQILIHVVGNSVKFTNDGGVYVFVLQTARTENSLTAEFLVKDSGSGISPDKADLLLNSFAQGEDSNGRIYSGAGLGLPIAKALAEMMGGSIRIEAPGEPGALVAVQVVFRLCGSAEAGLLNLEQAIHLADAKALAPMQPQQILVVDDRELDRNLLQHMLRHLGHSVELVRNGEKALQARASGRSYDLVIVDIHQPDSNVTELGRRLQETSPPDGNETLIALTDDPSKERERACMEAGFAEVIRKPIRMEGLRQLILRHTT